MAAKILFTFVLLVATRGDAQTQPLASDAEGQRLQTAGTIEQARDTFEQVLLRDPADALAQKGMSSTSERLALDARAGGHMDTALMTLLRAQKAIPEDKVILLDLGILEEEMDLHLDSEITLKKLAALPPINPTVYYAEARTEMSLGKLADAEKNMQSYLKVQPLDATAHFGLGKIYETGLAFDKASAEFQRSITLQPKQTEAYYETGQVYLSQNKFSEAIGFYSTALERSPTHGGALTGIGTAYFKLREYEKADDWLTKAVKVAPDYQPAHYYLGLTMARLGNMETSRKELDIATELAAKDSKQAASRLRLNPGEQP